MLKTPDNAVGFKEWSLVCDHLAAGHQALILRKGGIHEGRSGFQWQHRAFFLFPTWFHSQAQKLRSLPQGAQVNFGPEEERKRVDITAFAELEQVWRLTDWDRVCALADKHCWSQEVVRERFEYDEESCLHIALLRVWRLPQTWSLEYQKAFGGCRSWVNLPVEGLQKLEGVRPAIEAEAWQQLRQDLVARLGN